MTTIFLVLLSIAVTISASLTFILIHHHRRQKKTEGLTKESRRPGKYKTSATSRYAA